MILRDECGINLFTFVSQLKKGLQNTSTRKLPQPGIKPCFHERQLRYLPATAVIFNISSNGIIKKTFYRFCKINFKNSCHMEIISFFSSPGPVFPAFI